MAEEISQAERRKVLEEDRRAKTYMRQAEIDADLELGGGRFAKITKTTIVGASAGVTYPKLPEDSPSNQLARMPEEPSLGIDINAMDAVGEVWEQEASKSTERRRGWRRL